MASGLRKSIAKKSYWVVTFLAIASIAWFLGTRLAAYGVTPTSWAGDNSRVRIGRSLDAQTLAEIIHNSRQSIYLMASTVVSTEVLSALKEAHDRGVTVEVVLSANLNRNLEPTRSGAGWLINRNVGRVFLDSKNNQTHLLILDGKAAYVFFGPVSESFYQKSRVAILGFTNPAFVTEAQNYFEFVKQQSKKILG